MHIALITLKRRFNATRKIGHVPFYKRNKTTSCFDSLKRQIMISTEAMWRSLRLVIPLGNPKLHARVSTKHGATLAPAPQCRVCIACTCDLQPSTVDSMADCLTVGSCHSTFSHPFAAVSIPWSIIISAWRHICWCSFFHTPDLPQ